MKASNFVANAPGRIVRNLDGADAFAPNPLPSMMPLDEETNRLFRRAIQGVAELRGLGRSFQNPLLLINPFLQREAVLSSRIEGTHASAEQLALFEVAPTTGEQTNDVREVNNYVRAMQYGIAQIRDGRRVSLGLIKELHRILLTGVRGENLQPGEFRQRQNFIGSSRVITEARYVPPPAAYLPEVLDDLARYFTSMDEDYFLVQIALVHYGFEAIHPFLDGNGRIGRLLIALLLCDYRYLPDPLLYLSAYFERHRDQYMDALLAVSQKAAWKEWIDFFLIGVAEQASDAIWRIEKLQDLQREYQSKLYALPHRTTTVLRLADQLFATPAVTAASVATSLGVTDKSARQTISRLVDAGILREVTGRDYGRIYLASQIVDVITDEQAQPAARTQI